MGIEKTTYCRICEPLCGLIATVEEGKLVSLRPDKDHPVSKGFACPKGIAMVEVQNSEERVLDPLQRQSDGSFQRVTWEVALADIGRRLRSIRDQYGKEAIGFYLGNPSAFSYSTLTWLKGMAEALESPHFYGASSQDTNSRCVASALFYGSPLTIPIPDVTRTDFLVMLGATPIVSHGSLISGTNIREALHDLIGRGGRVVCIDPRRTETARMFEHIAVKPDGDAWLLLSLLHVIFADGLEDRGAVTELSNGEEALRRLVQRFPPEVTEEHSGVPAESVRALARDFATSPSAAFYGRVGACTGAFGTLVCFLIDTVNLVTGNLDRPGGAVFPTSPIDIYKFVVKNGLDTYATRRSRVGNLPEVLGIMPAAVMADEILTPGPGQLRAMLVVSGNPVLSVPNGPALERALEKLDLLIGLDIGVNDTNRHADYILPATTFLEREDMPLQMFPFQLRTFVQWTDAVVEPRGEARQEWTILRDICAELDLVPSSSKGVQRLGRIGRKIPPRLIFDTMLRIGPYGDRFGLRRGGVSVNRLRLHHPHGVVVADTVPTGVLDQRVTHPDGRVQLSPPEILAAVDRLTSISGHDPDYPYLLFGRRELRSINSWMKNASKLMAGGGGPSCSVHPEDARVLGLHDGAPARVTSRVSSVDVIVEVTDDVVRGSICLPHGWGHRVGVGGVALQDGGPSYNALTPAGADSVDPLSGMSHLNGVPVRIGPVTSD